MKQYEVTFIVDPVLSGDEIKSTAQTYIDALTNAGATIVNVDEMGLRQLAYPINNRTSGVYFCVEFQVETGDLIRNFELSFRRDERIMRFLTVALDKYGVKYNDDKRNGLIGKKSKSKSKDNDKAKGKGKNEIKKSPVKAEAVKTQSKISLAKETVTEVAGEEEE